MDNDLLRGWILLHRKFLDSPVWANHNVARLWTWCLLKASHRNHKQTVGYQEVCLLPGQFIFGRKVAAAETGLSEQSIRTCMAFLKKHGNLTSEPTNKFTVITIVNWKAYQLNGKVSNPKANQQLTNNQPATNQQLTTDNKGNKGNKGNNVNKNNNGWFTRFWEAWPKHKRKKAKALCQKKWMKDKLDEKGEYVLAVVEALKKGEEWAKKGGEFIPAPMVFLNKQYYDCDIEDIEQGNVESPVQIGSHNPPCMDQSLIGRDPEYI